jgi:YD repeat-containing protein
VPFNLIRRFIFSRAAAHIVSWPRAIAILASLASIGSVHAQVSYIGEYSFSVSAGDFFRSGLTSESAAIEAALSFGTASRCNVSLVNVTDWSTGGYDTAPVEGVETGASRSFNIYFNTYDSGICYDVTQSSSYTLRRQRLVCSSTQMFVDPKCVNLTPVVAHGQKGANLGPSCPSCGQPINPSTGNMWHVEKDYASSSTPQQLVVERTYNSVPYMRDYSMLRSFGLGWTHHYDSFLRPGPTLPDFRERKCWRRSDTQEIFCEWIVFTPSAIPESVTILRGDGKSYVFRRNGNEWIGDADTNDRISPVFDSTATAVLEWKYITGNGDVAERYDANGLLLSIALRSGNVQRFTYSTGQSNDTGVRRFPADAPVCTQTQAGTAVAANQLLCVTDNWGRQLNFKRDLSGRIVEAIDPAGRSTVYEYDGISAGCMPENPTGPACAANNLTKVTYPDGKSRTYIYNESSNINGGAACTYKVPLGVGLGHLPNSMTGLVDENGVRHINWTYDCSGRATASELANGVEHVKLAYNINTDGSATTTVTHLVGDPAAPQSTTRTFTALSFLGVIKNNSISGTCVECGPIASRTYDANGNVARAVDFNGAITTYVYDLSRNLETARTEASGTTVARTTTTAWHSLYRMPVQVAEPKRLTTYTHDDSGNVLTRVEHATTDLNGATGLAATVTGAPRTWSYTYNSSGNLTKVTGPRTDLADVTTYDYDSAGNLISVTNAAGHVTTLSNYDAHGRVGQIAAPNGTVTNLNYTVRGWLAAHSVTDGSVTETTNYEYDGTGQVKKVTMPDGAWTSYTYDAAHRLTGIADQTGNSVTYTLDLTGNRVREQVADPGGTLRRQIARVFDTTNRLKQQTGGGQ